MKAINTGLPDMMMFSINPAFDMLPPDEYVFDHFDKDFGIDLFRGIDPRRAELYKLCEQKQIGVTVMKSLGAGKLLSPELSPFTKPLSIAQCVHYALTRPAVASILPGCKTAAELTEVLRYFDLDAKERDYSEILGSMRNDFAGSCVYCSHCQPCPSEIDIAAVTRFLDIARLDKASVPPEIHQRYLDMIAESDECSQCGSCEARCPFGVSIIKNIEEAATIALKR